MKYTMVRYCSLEDLVKNYRNLKATRSACEECGMYGKRWTCPPFNADCLERFSGAARVMLILRKVSKEDNGKWSVSEMKERIDKEKILFDDMMLPMEGAMDGLLLTFTGACQFCGELPCSRVSEKSDSGCLHPESARSSLEAIGFDVCKIAAEIFDSPIRWSATGSEADYLSLVGALIFEPAS